MQQVKQENIAAGFVPEATIDVENLRLRTYIGFNPEELTKKQDVVINIQIRYALQPAVLGDSVEDALNYKTVTKAVIECVENGRFLPNRINQNNFIISSNFISVRIPVFRKCVTATFFFLVLIFLIISAVFGTFFL